ncbi:MAG: hypothetical protein OJF52_003567 [Nitrospira sp.]|nr:MAG: hypothetical protein OJF52_003567 [Nitrospira sp.]
MATLHVPMHSGRPLYIQPLLHYEADSSVWFRVGQTRWCPPSGLVARVDPDASFPHSQGLKL